MRPLALALALVTLAGPAGAQAIVSRSAVHHPVRARHGMVAAQEALAARAGAEILRRGGNAVDAAVAVSFALAVTLPRAGNLGGGGFMLIRDAKAAKTLVIDFRETAPAAANPRRFYTLEPAKKPGDAPKKRAIPGMTSTAPFGIAVPGSVAGMLHALETHGTMKRQQVLAAAIALARRLKVTDDLAYNLHKKRALLGQFPATRAIFFHPSGRTWQRGETLVQADLARTLERIAEHGRAGFYEGPVAAAISAATKTTGGAPWITRQDLASYRVRTDLKPAVGTYRGRYQIHSMPMPSSGGVHLVQMLNILEGYAIGEHGPNSARTIHLLAEAMRRAYADRSKYLGDPDYFQLDDADRERFATSRAKADALARGLTSRGYAAALRKAINIHRATPSARVRPGDPLPYESVETTHYSVADRHGNLVSVTTTLNFSYGCGKVAAGTGVLLNNEMDDFAVLPGVPNAYGLVGGKANAIGPGKRPLSSMTPTIVLKDGQPWLATGSPGGSRIITTTLQLILNLIDHRMNLAEATAAPRVHHQWLPDVLRLERGISPDTVRLLEQAYGHTTVTRSAMGSLQSVIRLPGGGFLGSSDPRRPGAGAVGVD